MKEPMTDRDVDRASEELTEQFVDLGKLVASGFAAMRLMHLDPDVPPVQLTEMRFAYFSGAQHVFSTLMMLLAKEHATGDKLATLQRIDKINTELEDWCESEVAALRRHAFRAA